MENLRDIVKNHLSEGVVLLGLSHDLKSDYVKVTIDSPRNISIKETSQIAKSIRNDVNIASMFPKGCRLEVGTPGVGTNLVKDFQYKKNIGREIFIQHNNDISNIGSGVFRLINVEKEGIIIRKSNRDYLILFENIVLAKIKISFD